MKLAINTFSIVFKLWFSFMFCIYGLNAQITSYPYLEDFESGPGGWTVHGANTSWELGVPSATYINSAASGNIAWVTNLSGDHSTDEFGWVESPVFDLSSLTTPYLQFNYYLDCATPDAATIQISTDEGANWNTLISSDGNPPSGTIINWMNYTGTIGPLSTSGWSNYFDYWKTAVYTLEDFLGVESIKFRIVFGSDHINQFNGFAFDRFQISDTYCYAGEEEDYYNNDPDSNWIRCIDNGENVDLNAVVDDFLTNTGRTPNFVTRRWEFLSGPFGPRGPKVITLSNDDDDADFPNTGSGLGQLFTFNYIVEDGQCQDNVEINICMDPEPSGSYDEKVLYICSGESIENGYELFNAFSLNGIREIAETDFYGDLVLKTWYEDVAFGNDAQYPIDAEGFYVYEDNTSNQLEAEVVELDCSDKDIELSFANAQNTTDGTDDFYEVDVMIKTTTPGSSFKLGDGKLFIRYNTDAFGTFVNAYKNVQITHPSDQGYIAGQTIDSDPNVNVYSSLFPLDNINGVADPENITDSDIFRFSWSFRQLYSTTMFAADNVSNTPAKLCRIKIKYEDSSYDPQLVFEGSGIYDNKFTTAAICGWVNGGPDITDCTSEPKTLIINDNFSSVLSTTDYSTLNSIVLHPNPSNGTVNVSGNMGSLNRIQVFSVTGALVKEVETTLDVIDISNLKSGLYFFKLLGDNATKTVRVIKQ
ncbi:T9SS type A sorting domain-containing protein [Winogradskyella ouciana]|uniref:T9SS type A sorting domain-containing protein n=1 Tax=Winogradskyella ouciana TaxID=2608631 RepID=A0A7K1GG00_9FLAO|nr:T9SS type A sorting domain-containing protein [Winogradskyella ouciana]MTE28242.1 T9SS type A sorting domain-containing protein [Winogradskyella ouciana]